MESQPTEKRKIFDIIKSNLKITTHILMTSNGTTHPPLLKNAHCERAYYV